MLVMLLIQRKRGHANIEAVILLAARIPSNAASDATCAGRSVASLAPFSCRCVDRVGWRRLGAGLVRSDGALFSLQLFVGKSPAVYHSYCAVRRREHQRKKGVSQIQSVEDRSYKRDHSRSRGVSRKNGHADFADQIYNSQNDKIDFVAKPQPHAATIWLCANAHCSSRFKNKMVERSVRSHPV